jgi:hypothetical protein
MNRCCLGGLALCGVWLVTSPAAAQSANRVSLRWSAPDECPDDVRLVHAVEALLGQSLSDAGTQSLSVHASVLGSEATGFSAKLSFASPQGPEQRFLEHPRCDQLLEAVALVVALAIDPERVHATQLAAEDKPVPPPEPEPREVEVQASPTLPRNPEPAAPSSSPSEQRLRGARFALHGTLGAGPLPNFGAGIEATLGWHRGPFRAELVARYWIPRTASLNLAPSSSLRVGLETLGARGCWVTASGSWAVAACGGGDVGDQSVAGQGLENPRTQHAIYADLAGGLQLAYTRWPLRPEGGFEVAGALARPRFGVLQDGSGVQVYKPAAWGFSAFLGFAFEL